MAEIAVALPGSAFPQESGAMAARLLVEGSGWAVSDLVCTAGPQDRPFEEQHAEFHIALVMAGSFQYRSAAGGELMTPGSVLLANAEQNFACSHEHSTGDRCLSFRYAPEHFRSLAADVGVRGSASGFRVLRLPPLRLLSTLAARARAGVAGAETAWEEISVELAAQAVRLAHGLSGPGHLQPNALERVSRCILLMEEHPERDLTLAGLAQEAGLSSFHFLRTFKALIGMTPHQYLRRTRLREAAARLMARRSRIIDVALECGFGDISNFNHAFRAEFGMSPQVFRRRFG